MDSGTGLYLIKDSVCNCTFYTQYQLPCRHLIYLAVANNTLPELKGNSRWEKVIDEELVKGLNEESETSEDEDFEVDLGFNLDEVNVDVFNPSARGNMHYNHQSQPSTITNSKASSPTTRGQMFNQSKELVNRMAEAMSRLSTNEYQSQLRLLNQQLHLIESGRPYHIVEGLPGIGLMDGVQEALDQEIHQRVNQDIDTEKSQQPTTREMNEPQAGPSNYQTRLPPSKSGAQKRTRLFDKYKSRNQASTFQSLNEEKKKKSILYTLTID